MPRAGLLYLAVAVLLASASNAEPLSGKKRTLLRSSKSRETAAFEPDQARTLACGGIADSTNSAAPNRMDAYACAEFDESGGEVLYRIVLGTYAELYLILDELQDDLDLFLLGANRSDACLAASTGVSSEQIRLCLAPGTYYAVVDGFSGAVSSFRLRLDCTACKPCTPVVDNDTCDRAIPLLPRDVATRVVGSTRCATDDYSGGMCTGFTSAGRDVVYRVSMPPGCAVRVTLRDGGDGVPLDRAVYLASSCADMLGTCVAGSDRGVAEEESFTYDSADGGIYYLVVDSFGTDTGGDFELEILQTNCSVIGVESRSWEQLKSLYR